MKDGNEEYEKNRFLFSMLPAVGILWGAGVLWMVWQLSRTVRRKIVEPVVMLAGEAERIGKNDFSGPELKETGEDEIGLLIRSFNKMKAATKGYIEALKENHEKERQLEAVRLQMLKSQINPHFLFNTLNMIAGTAQIEDAAATEKMIHALSRLFRYNLKSAASVMPLERELRVGSGLYVFAADAIWKTNTVFHRLFAGNIGNSGAVFYAAAIGGKCSETWSFNQKQRRKNSCKKLEG